MPIGNEFVVFITMDEMPVSKLCDYWWTSKGACACVCVCVCVCVCL